MAFATLPDVKTHLNKTSTADDAELQDMLDAAEDVVRSLVGPATPTAVTNERVTAVGGTVILRHRPVADVTLNGGAVTGFVVSGEAGLLYDVPAGYEPLTATYTAGAATVPAALRLATAIIAAHLWETQRGTSPTALALQQSGVEDQPFTPGAGFAIPNRARELLAPYLQQSQVA